MVKLIETITAKLRRRLVVVLFVFSAVSLLLGIIGGQVDLSGSAIPEIATPYRITAIALGILFVLLAIVIELRESQPRGTLPPDLSLSFSARRAYISSTQDDILRHIINNIALLECDSQSTKSASAFA